MKMSLKFIGLALLLAACNNKPVYENTSMPAAERAAALVKELTADEKIALMMDASAPIERLGIKKYNWWNEALHGVGRAGRATVFPQPIGMAATFDDSLVFDVFTTVSDEARAKYVQQASQGNHERYQGLTMWTPTINIYRDPRWGRGIETYGEDPYLTSVMGVAAVKGLQGEPQNGYDKLHVCAKHFAVHSGPEWNRHTFNAEDIKPRDLHETYLPAFEALVKEGQVKEVMCAYNRFEGEPCCGSNKLLVQILREEWGFDGIVVADCGAIADFYNDRGHKAFPDAATASADAVYHGTDLDCGSSYEALKQALEQKIITEETIDKSVERLMKARYELGEMDDLALNPWNKIPYSTVASSEHHELALETARKSIVLLQNKNNLLPLKEGITVAVMGPNANDSVMQWGNYNGIPAATTTILKGINNLAGANCKIIYEQGCGHTDNKILKSAFAQCSNENGAGFTAKYWNNTRHEGEPAATTQVSTPFRFCTSGATVFAPGVNLTDFSATYTSTFRPQQSGEVALEIYAYGSGKLYIDGTEVRSFRNTHGGRKTTYALQVEKGESYDLQIDFEYTRSDAQLDFDLGYREEKSIDSIVNSVSQADVVVFAGGISPALEGEEMGVNIPGFKRGDRTDIELPAVQRQLLQALHRAGKKIVLVNCSGSPIGFVPETISCDAIIQAWYPGEAGGQAIAEVLWGKYNPGGCLPVTFYKDISQLPDFEDYDMENRTYRYLKEEPLFPFGYGLSYTQFAYQPVNMEKNHVATDESLRFSVEVSNTGRMDGDEVVQVYWKKKGDEEGPSKTLRAFKRVHIPAGEARVISFELSPKQLEWWDAGSNTMRTYESEYELMVGSSSRTADLECIPVTIE